MSSKVEKNDKNVAVLEIEVSARTFDDAVQKSFKKNQHKYQVHGFRKGKAPRALIERFYGEGVFYEDAFELLYQVAYDEAIVEHNLEPVTPPEISVVQIGNGKPFIFTAKITLKPDVVVKDYIGIEVENPKFAVSEEDISAHIKQEQEKSARIHKAEDRSVQYGDICILDYKGSVDGVAFEGGEAQNESLVIGSGTFVPGFEEQMIAKETGQEFEISVTFPNDYHNEELSGKDATFKITLHEIKYKVLPELDDNFAQDVSEFDTFEEYKASVKTYLEEKTKEREKEEIEGRILKKLIERAEVDVPQAMIESRMDQIIEEFAQSLKYRGVDLKQYLQYSGIDYSIFRKSFEERASDDVKTNLIIEAISKLENVEVSSEELEEYIKDIAKSSKLSYEDFMAAIKEENKESVKYSLIFERTLKLIIDNAKVL